MAFSAGVYTLPTPALVPGQTVSSSENNTVRNDMAASFNLTWLRNGTAAATANIPMGSYKLTGLGAATTSGDALSYGNAAVVTTLTSTSLTATRVPYAGTGGLLQDASTFTFDGTTLTAGGFSGPHNGTVGATTPNTGAFTTLSASSTVSGTGFSTYLASPPAIGGTAAAAGSFTTLTTSSTVTVNGGTANGVAYLNGSKVLTTGSAITFDGTNFATTGTASATKLIPTGGTATGNGMYLPSANTLAWSNNGSETMRLDSSGNLGLGVTPSAWGSSFKAIELAAGSLSSTSTNISISSNAYRGSSSWTYSTSAAAALYQASGGAHYWYNAPSGTAGNAITFTQAMTLDASGNLGIGTSSPVAGYRLNVVNDSGNAQQLIRAGTNYNSTISFGDQDSSTSGQLIYAHNGDYMAFNTNASERMRIGSSGNVGIGTSSPSCPLNVVSASSGLAFAINGRASDNLGGLYFYANNGSTSHCQITSSATEFRVASQSTAVQTFYTNGSERMRIDSDGNIYGTAGTTGMTNGFFYIPSAGGAPSGTPTAVTGRVPMYYDTTNNQFYVYNGAWKKVTLA